MCTKLFKTPAPASNIAIADSSHELSIARTVSFGFIGLSILFCGLQPKIRNTAPARWSRTRTSNLPSRLKEKKEFFAIIICSIKSSFMGRQAFDRFRVNSMSARDGLASPFGWL